MYNNGNNRFNNRPNQTYGQTPPSIQPVKAEPLPEDYVKKAEEAIAALKGKVITTSKLRSLFSLFSETYNEVIRGDQEKLTPPQVAVLSAAKVRVYYEIGREDGYRGDLNSGSVGRFVKYSKLLEYLYDIGDSCEKLIQFYHYMEALVAFHRYYFGEKRDNR
ncbi:MAG: type III-A CRISPR-associated protein Csm2 [Clostridia bacterium]|nr:type III-A CRISPR-associated protein Csm2 [Clostridia bacterium]